jgi:hypothetical protein
VHTNLPENKDTATMVIALRLNVGVCEQKDG